MASALLLTVLNVSIIGCPMSKDILPCTCKLDKGSHLKTIGCGGMGSFDEIYSSLHGHFVPTDRISLKILGSKLEDLPVRSFKELNVSIESLQLNHDHLGKLNALTFEGLTGVTYLSLADNYLDQVPEHLWKYVPNVKTLDLGRTKIKTLNDLHFKNLPYLEALIVPGCQINRMEAFSIPRAVQRLHVGRNSLRTLNGTIKGLTDLVWLFINANNLTNLDGELPANAQKLKMIHSSYNNIEKLPSTLTTLPSLETVFFQNNKIRSLDGTLAKSRKLQRLHLDNNDIDTLTEDDFKEAESLVHLLLGYNKIKNLNNSLLALRNLQFLNISMNLLEEFSFQEITGLERLSAIDLSFNQISAIKGSTSNLVEWNIRIKDLKLDHNEIVSLNGSLSGLRELVRLNVAFNKLDKISPDDFIGLDQLSFLDLSYNRLKTLEEMSKTYLPKLEVLKASHNFLTILEKDFQGLPVLCQADLSNNQIIALGRDLVIKTRCKLGNAANEGTWDTLKIYLQDNPILCDAALPEISSAMEINHTRIYGVSHCAPLSEQPVTSKPNRFLGYVPDNIAVPGAISASIQEKTAALQPLPLSIPAPNIIPLNLPSQEGSTKATTLKPMEEIAVRDQDIMRAGQTINNDSINLSKLVTEVELLKTKVAELDAQLKTDKPNEELLDEKRKQP